MPPAPRPASRSTPTARLSGPAELAAALPVLLGFVPHESVVLVCLEGRRVGLTVRCDLPVAGAEGALVEDLRDRPGQAGADRVFVFLCTEQEPTEALVTRLRELPVEVLDLVHLRAGRWRSLLCRDSACCPPDGLPLPTQAPALTLVRAEAALQGRAVLPDRAALVAGLQPPALSAPDLEAFRDTALALSEEVLERGRAATRTRLADAFRAALRTGSGTAELAVGLQDVLLRDEVLALGLQRPDRLYALLLDLLRTTPAPYDAPACACLAWVAYQRGDGAVAAVALDRALATDPQHGLALLLRAALDRQVPPRELRAVTASVRRVLR